MTSSNGSNVALFVLALLCGGVGYLLGKSGNAPLAPPAPPAVVTSSPASTPGPVVTYVPQTGTLFVVDGSVVYKLDARTLDLLDSNRLDDYRLPFAVRRKRNAIQRAAQKDIDAENDEVRKAYEAEVKRRFEQSQGRVSP